MVMPDEQGLLWLPSCGSTNDEALSRVDDLSVRAVGADVQTAGRGRRGRTWLSSEGQGLYLSVIARPSFSARLGAVLPLLAAVATAEVLEELGLLATVKWPNDLLVGGRKLAGVLCEARGTTTRWHAVVGIGLNLRTPAAGWPADIPATALDAHLDLVPSARSLAPKLMHRLERGLERVEHAGDPRATLAAWERFSPPRGTWMRRGELAGRFAGLAPDGALRLEVEGEITLIHAGDVELVTEDLDRAVVPAKK